MAAGPSRRGRAAALGALLLALAVPAAIPGRTLQVKLEPTSAGRTVGEQHTVTATAVPDVTVTFEVLKGPHAGLKGEGATGRTSSASFTYAGTKAGTDTLRASYTDAQGVPHGSNEATVTWSDPAPPPPPPTTADLAGSLASGAPSATVGGPVSFTATVANLGPGAATGVTVTGSVSELVSLASATPSQGTCSLAGRSFACGLGTLPAGASATVALSGTATSTGEAHATVGVAADQPDPDAANNSAPATVPVSVPPPSLGRAVNLTPVSGVVLVNGKRLGAEEQIPVGAVVDARRGVLELETANGTGRFWAGRFRILERRVRGGFTELRLLGGNFRAGCGHPVRRPSGAEEIRTHRRKVVRRLWGNATGSFRTSGRFSAATIRGTRWLTADRCDGTRTTVRQGSVVVLDRIRKKRVVVRAGRSYLARPG